MREIAVGGTTFQVRSLKRKEVKQLKKDGFNLADLGPHNADDAMDKAFELAFTPNEVALIDDLSNSEALAIWVALIKETVGAADEEKN